MSNHLQILQTVGCSAEIGKEGQLSRSIDFNLLEDLASQRSQPGFFLGNLGTSYLGETSAFYLPLSRERPRGLILSESCL